MSSNNILMVLKGSKILSNSWKQELVIKEHEVTGEVISGLKKIKMSLPYEKIAQVNIIRGVIKADLEVINAGGTNNLIVQALNKEEAEEAKRLIESKIQQAKTSPSQQLGYSVADELKKLARLKDEGIISQHEFDLQKSKLLS